MEVVEIKCDACGMMRKWNGFSNLHLSEIDISREDLESEIQKLMLKFIEKYEPKYISLKMSLFRIREGRISFKITDCDIQIRTGF